MEMMDHLIAEKLTKIIKTAKWGKSHKKNILKRSHCVFFFLQLLTPYKLDLFLANGWLKEKFSIKFNVFLFSLDDDIS